MAEQRGQARNSEEDIIAFENERRQREQKAGTGGWVLGKIEKQKERVVEVQPKQEPVR